MKKVIPALIVAILVMIVLLTLYYPRRTYEQAAEALGVDVSTISRQRKNAVERLARRVARLEGEGRK